MILASRGEGHPTESHYRQAGSGTAGSGAAGSNVVGPTAAGSSDGTTLVPATPILRELASNPIPTGGSAAEQDYRLGVTFDSSADKHAATGRQDAATRGRPATQGWDDKSRPASLAKGACERSSVWTTSKQAPRQGVEHPSGMPRNAPPASTLGSTLCQCSGSTKAPRDPLERVAHYRSQG